MPDAEIRLVRPVRLIAATIALIVAVSLPLAYWLVAYSFLAEATSSDAAAHADLLTERINDDPELWRFEIPRLDAIVSTHRDHDDSADKHYILDERGVVLAQSEASIASPILTRSAPLFDSGAVVGRFVASRSLVPLMQHTALVALFGLVLALAVYVSLSVLPLRALARALAALEQERERLRAIVDNAVEGIITFDRQGILQSLNPAAADMFGYSSADAIGRGAGELLPEIAIDKPDGQRYLGTLETVGRRRDGGRFPIEVAISQATLDGKPQLIAIAHDISERRRAEQAFQKSAADLRLFAENVPAMAASLDENLHFVFANKRYADFFGFDREDIVGRHLREVVGEDVYREIEGNMAQMLQGHPVDFRRTHTLQNGESRHLEIKILPRIGDQGKVLGCYSVTTDITEHMFAQERIQRVAHHDSLTGLPNRLLFNDRLEQAISLAKRDSRRFALLYLDLDGFKAVNDSLGHTAGDELLKSVAGRIRHQVRESDTVARIGGDEFTVILPDIARHEDAQTVARKIIAALASPFQLGSQQQSVEIGTSIGIALYPADAGDADALIKAADAAMYGAKQAGSGFR